MLIREKSIFERVAHRERIAYSAGNTGFEKGDPFLHAMCLAWNRGAFALLLSILSSLNIAFARGGCVDFLPDSVMMIQPKGN